MAKITEGLTVVINASLYVDRATAESCLKLVESYINRTGANIIVEKLDDGTLNLDFKEAD